MRHEHVSLICGRLRPIFCGDEKFKRNKTCQVTLVEMARVLNHNIFMTLVFRMGKETFS